MQPHVQQAEIVVADNERHGTEYSIAFMNIKNRGGVYRLEVQNKCNFN